MGLDGGTIISRSDVLRGQCWELNQADTTRSSRGGAVRGIHKRKKLDARSLKVTRWSTCALSGEPLAAPVVACFLGRLYNKSAVLELLLARAGRFADEAAEHRYLNQLRTAGDAYDHIASLKDVFMLQFSPAAASAGAPAVTTAADSSGDAELPAPFTCPLTALRCDRHPFAALAGCGHVFSERALKETASDSTCPTCGASFLPEQDVVPLLPGEEQLEVLLALLPERRQHAKQAKQQEKKAKRKREQGEVQQGRQEQAGSKERQRQQQAGSTQGQRQRQQQPGTS